MAIAGQTSFETYRKTGNTKHLDNAITEAQNPLKNTPVGHRDRADVLNALCYFLHSRYERTGQLSVLQEAIRMGEEALSVTPLEHAADRATCLNNLSNSFKTPFDLAVSARLPFLVVNRHGKQSFPIDRIGCFQWKTFQANASIGLVSGIPVAVTSKVIVAPASTFPRQLSRLPSAVPVLPATAMSIDIRISRAMEHQAVVDRRHPVVGANQRIEYPVPIPRQHEVAPDIRLDVRIKELVGEGLERFGAVKTEMRRRKRPAGDTGHLVDLVKQGAVLPLGRT